MGEGGNSAAQGGVIGWVPSRHALDPHAFDCGRVGPYALGPEVRAGPFGPIHIALCRHFDPVLEIEFVEAEPLHPRGAGAPALAPHVLESLNHCVGLRHPHVSALLGAGLDEGVPYMLRAHGLGRSLADVFECGLAPPPDVATGILYGVAEGLGFLAESGPRPGACALGGLRREAILLGWDGSVRLLGAGLSVLGDERPDADLRGLLALARALESDLGAVVEGAADIGEVARRLRKGRREACAERQPRIGAWLRQEDADACAAYRRFFALDTLN